MKDLRCIDPEIGKLIGHYETGHLKGGERDRFEIHLINCTYCFNEAFQIQPAIARLRMKGPAVVTQISRGRARPKPTITERFLSLRDSRRWAGLVLLFLAAIAAACLYIARSRNRVMENRTLPANASPRNQVLSPTGRLDRAPTELRWKIIPHVLGYEVEIFDGNKKSLWKGQTLKGNLGLPLPEEVRARLRPGVEYHWEVKGIPQNRFSWPKSETTSFKISPEAQPKILIPQTER